MYPKLGMTTAAGAAQPEDTNVVCSLKTWPFVLRFNNECGGTGSAGLAPAVVWFCVDGREK